jgi:hypothetical protein
MNHPYFYNDCYLYYNIKEMEVVPITNITIEATREVPKQCEPYLANASHGQWTQVLQDERVIRQSLEINKVLDPTIQLEINCPISVDERVMIKFTIQGSWKIERFLYSRFPVTVNSLWLLFTSPKNY